MFHLQCMINALLYKTYKNKLNHTLHLAKRLYCEKKLQDVKSNTDATCKILNEVLNRKCKSKPQANTVFRSDNLEIKTDSAQSSSNKCKNYKLLKIYS